MVVSTFNYTEKALKFTIFWWYSGITAKRCDFLPTCSQMNRICQKMKKMKLQYFYIFMYVWWLLKLLWCFFVESLKKRTVISELARIINKKSTILTKTAACSHHCTHWHEHYYWGIGIPTYATGSTIQARAITPPSWGSAPRWLQAMTNRSQRDTFCKKKMKVMKLQYFTFLCIFDGFLNLFFCGVFCGNLTEPHRHARTGKCYQQKAKF